MSMWGRGIRELVSLGVRCREEKRRRRKFVYRLSVIRPYAGTKSYHHHQVNFPYHNPEGVPLL
jgi:hypothetical protein